MHVLVGMWLCAFAAAATQEVALQDARLNFAGVVEGFIDERSPKGYWPLRDKVTGKIRRLKLLRIEEDSVNAVGKTRFNGTALLKDVRGGKLVSCVFTVDFAAPPWKVVRMTMTPIGQHALSP